MAGVDAQLVGSWRAIVSTPDPTANGQMGHTMFTVTYSGNGEVRTEIAVTNSAGSALYYQFWHYDVTQPGRYDAVLVDYSPKQNCGGGLCMPMASLAPVGSRANCTYQISPGALTVDCNGGGPIRYERAN